MSSVIDITLQYNKLDKVDKTKAACLTISQYYFTRL